VAGLRSAVGDDPVQRDDLWHVGSITKSMTATLVARLAESGTIAWEDAVGEVLGDLPVAIDPAYAEATYADLLSHRSGLAANLGFLASIRLAGTDENREAPADRRTYAAMVLSRKPNVAPGSFLYSNAGYVVAGAMLEATTGESWETLIRREVFDPLGMDSAGFGPPGSPDVVDQPRGHRRLLGIGPLRPAEPGPAADNIPALGPAGRVHANAADMLKYLAAHATKDPGFLHRESWVRLHSKLPGGDYALGWRREPDGRLTHDGSNTMWYARATFWPAEARALFMAVNRAGALKAPGGFDAAETAASAD
jgi:D-alanyl-D-alanine carboxypeptidase